MINYYRRLSSFGISSAGSSSAKVVAAAEPCGLDVFRHPQLLLSCLTDASAQVDAARAVSATGSRPANFQAFNSSIEIIGQPRAWVQSGSSTQSLDYFTAS